MENFNLDNFDPTTAQLQTIAESYKGLTIEKDGLFKLKEAKADLRNKRTFISKTLKADRDKAIRYQKDNIAKEKELLAIIAPVEAEIDLEFEKQEQAEEMAKRIETLPIRREELKKLGIEKDYTEEFLLSMSYMEFMDFIISEKARLFEESQEKVRQLEAEAKRQADLKEAEARGREQAEAKAKQEAEAKEKEEQIKQEAEIQAKAKAIEDEQKEKDRIEKGKKYKQRLEDNGYNDTSKQNYKIEKEGDNMVLYKIVSSFKI